MTGGERPPVDVVIPFFGDDEDLRLLQEKLSVLRRSPGDSLTIVDNRPWAPDDAGDEVIPARERQSSYFARNRGVERGSAPWVVFLDADVSPQPDLIERYFEREPGPETAILEGVVEITPGRGRVARYGALRQHVGNENVRNPGFEYAQTANVAIRRQALEEVGGFVDDIRSGGDADLCFRIRDAGWQFEHRPSALVTHPPRSRLRPMLRQFGRYGSGAQWLAGRYPGFSPPVSMVRVVGAVLKMPLTVPVARIRGGRDDALLRGIDPLVALAFETGRLRSNLSRPRRRDSLRHALGVLKARAGRATDAANQ